MTNTDPTTFPDVNPAPAAFSTASTPSAFELFARKTIYAQIKSLEKISADWRPGNVDHCAIAAEIADQIINLSRWGGLPADAE